MKKYIISILFIIILILLTGSKASASSLLKIETPSKNAVYESVEKMPTDLIWIGNVSDNVTYYISLKSTDAPWYSVQNPYITSTSLNYQQAQCIKKNNKNYCKYPLSFASTIGTFTITVSDQSNNSDVVNFTVKDSNTENRYSSGYLEPTQFTWPISSTVFETIKGKLIDSKLEFALAYYNIGDTYNFNLFSDKNKKVASLGKIKIDKSSDQYKGDFKVSKKIKPGYYYLTAENTNTKKIVKSAYFEVKGSPSYSNSKDISSVRFYLQDELSLEFFINDSNSKDSAVGDCMWQKESETEGKCVFSNGKKVKKSDLKNLGDFKAVVSYDNKQGYALYKSGGGVERKYVTKKTAVQKCKDYFTKNPGTKHECFWKGKKINADF
jgi:hypothetical protein